MWVLEEFSKGADIQMLARSTAGSMHQICECLAYLGRFESILALFFDFFLVSNWGELFVRADVGC